MAYAARFKRLHSLEDISLGHCNILSICESSPIYGVILGELSPLTFSRNFLVFLFFTYTVINDGIEGKLLKKIGDHFFLKIIAKDMDMCLKLIGKIELVHWSLLQGLYPWRIFAAANKRRLKGRQRGCKGVIFFFKIVSFFVIYEKFG